MHIPRWKTPTWKRCILYYSNYMKFWKWKMVSSFQWLVRRMNRTQRIFSAVKLVCRMLKLWVYVIIHLSNLIECITLRINPNINYGLWVKMMSQCRFLTCNRCTTAILDMGSEEGCVCWNTRCMGTPHTIQTVCYKAETTLKDEVYLKRLKFKTGSPDI